MYPDENGLPQNTSIFSHYLTVILKVVKNWDDFTIKIVKMSGFRSNEMCLTILQAIVFESLAYPVYMKTRIYSMYMQFYDSENMQTYKVRLLSFFPTYSIQSAVLWMGNHI